MDIKEILVAIVKNDLHTIETFPQKMPRWVLDEAIMYNKISIIRFLINNGYHQFTEFSFQKAVKHNDLNLVKYLVSKGCKPDETGIAYVKENCKEIYDFLQK